MPQKKTKSDKIPKRSGRRKQESRPLSSQPGILIIIGGGEDKIGACVILKTIAERVGKKKLIISTVASLEPQGYYDAYQETFHRLGLTQLEQHYLAERSETNNPDMMALLANAGGIFFSGGDQLRISSLIGDTPFEIGVRQIYENGGVIAGTSAGATAMGETMLLKGGNSVSCKIGDIHMAPGLGLMPNVIIDQHFAERGRVGRLLGAIAMNPRILGIGIDEDTAILVSGDTFEVIGSGAVYIVDGATVRYTNIGNSGPDNILSIFGLRIHVLSSGDGFNLKLREPLLGK